MESKHALLTSMEPLTLFPYTPDSFFQPFYFYLSSFKRKITGGGVEVFLSQKGNRNYMHNSKYAGELKPREGLRPLHSSVGTQAPQSTIPPSSMMEGSAQI